MGMQTVKADVAERFVQKLISASFFCAGTDWHSSTYCGVICHRTLKNLIIFKTSRSFSKVIESVPEMKNNLHM